MIATAYSRESAPSPARAARDAQLVAQLAAAAQGDSRAFEAFYDATAGHARTLARRVLQGSDVDDLWPTSLSRPGAMPAASTAGAVARLPGF